MNVAFIDFVLIIPCYNNSDGLHVSLKSISYPKDKCEILIIDDGSIPAINEKELQETFSGLTINVIRLDYNKGIVNALNLGLDKLKRRNNVKYIARLDAGDICDQHRFTKQINFLNAHTDVALLASWARFENSSTGRGYDYITQVTHAKILKEMHFKCSFIHPSVIFRAEVLNIIGVYPEDFPHAEDYAFFWQILKSYEGAVLPEKLVQIMYTDKNVSAKHYKVQLQSRKKVVRQFGSSWLHKMIGITILNLKIALPQKLIIMLKNAY